MHCISFLIIRCNSPSAIYLISGAVFHFNQTIHGKIACNVHLPQSATGQYYFINPNNPRTVPVYMHGLPENTIPYSVPNQIKSVLCSLCLLYNLQFYFWKQNPVFFLFSADLEASSFPNYTLQLFSPVISVIPLISMSACSTFAIFLNDLAVCFEAST